MANYIKSFNFRNGVQVDNDNFIVNSAGKVGIGTTVPDKILDVRGNAKIVGHITATDASVSGIVTVGSIVINGNTGTISATNFSGFGGNFPQLLFLPAWHGASKKGCCRSGLSKSGACRLWQ